MAEATTGRSSPPADPAPALPEDKDITSSIVNEGPTTSTGSLLGEAAPTEEVDTGYDWNQKIFDSFKGEDGEVDHEKLAESFKDMRKKVSQNVGPDSIEQYTTEVDNVDPEVYKAFKEEARGKKLSPDQFEWLMEKRQEILDEMAPPSEEKVREALTGVWGNDFEIHQGNAKKAFEQFGTGLNIEALASNPDTMRLLARIGAELGEDKLSRNESFAQPDTITDPEIRKAMRDGTYYTKAFQERLSKAGVLPS